MPSTALDTIDRRILQVLQADAKVTNAELARRVGLWPAPCRSRVRALERAGVIARHVTLLDPLKVGLGVSVFIQVSLEQQTERSLAAFQAAIAACPEDYLLRVAVPDIAAYDAFYKKLISRIEIAKVSSAFAMEQMKYTTSLPLQFALTASKAERADAH